MYNPKLFNARAESVSFTNLAYAGKKNVVDLLDIIEDCSSDVGFLKVNDVLVPDKHHFIIDRNRGNYLRLIDTKTGLYLQADKFE